MILGYLFSFAVTLWSQDSSHIVLLLSCVYGVSDVVISVLLTLWMMFFVFTIFSQSFIVVWAALHLGE